MANVKFPREEFEKSLGKKINTELEEKIHLFGTPIESLSSEEIEIEIFPNRPDLLSMQGFLRSFKSFLGKKTGLKEYKVNKPKKDYSVKIDSSVKKVRPYTVCAIIKNLKFNNKKIKEIIDLQEKLHATIGRNRKKAAIGIYPLEKIKLPIKYEAKKPSEIKFVPLETNIEMTANQILKKHPAGKIYANLLKDLKEFPIFTDSSNKILSMPPIINSLETGRITGKTKDLFIECSGFDKKTLNKTLNIIATTFAEMGGEIYSMTLQYENKKETSPDLSPQKMKVSIENTNKLLGLDLKEKSIENLIEKMGHQYNKGMVKIPAWRTDILHEVDLIEDIAIAYGYENFVPQISKISVNAEESRESKLRKKISEILIGLNLLEISSYHLIKPEEAKKAKISRPIEIEETKTEYKILRSNLLVPTLRILAENKDQEYPQNTFEIGTIFSFSEKEESGIKENSSLLIALSPANFTEAKQNLDNLIRSLALEYNLEHITKQGFIDGRVGKITLDKKEIGYIGEIHPNTLKEWNLKMPLAIIELNLDVIYKKLD